MPSIRLWPEFGFTICCTFVVVTCDLNNETRLTQNPTPFITDGNSSVVLTCLAASAIPGVTTYGWLINPAVLFCEEENFYKNTCTYKPEIEDAEKNVTCNVYSPSSSFYEEGILRPLYFFLPTIPNFTINKQHTREDAYENIPLYCASRGRPAPHVYVYDNTGHVISSNVTSSISDVRTDSVLSVTDCQQTGWYRCEANNSLPNGKQSSRLFMNVTCPPKAAVNNAFINISNISNNEVLDFTLKSNPQPHDFYFKLEAGGLNGTEKPGDLSLSLYELQASCSPDPDKPYLARCSVKAMNFPSDYLGLYKVTAVSTLGNFSFLFRVNTIVVKDKPQPQQPQSDSARTIAPVVIIPVVSLCLIAAVSCLIRRLRSTNPSRMTYLGDEQAAAVPNRSATPYSVTRDDDENICEPSSFYESSFAESSQCVLSEETEDVENTVSSETKDRGGERGSIGV